MRNNTFWKRTGLLAAAVAASANMITAGTMASQDQVLNSAETERMTEQAEEKTTEEMAEETETEKMTAKQTDKMSEELPQETGRTETEETETENWLDELDDWIEEWEETEWEEEYNWEDTENVYEENFPQENETSDDQLQTEAVQELKMSDAENYLTVRFEQGISSLECFPENGGAERVVQNGFTMLNLRPGSLQDKGRVGARYRRVIKQGEKWYDLKMTLEDFGESEIISKEGTVAVFPEISFCTDRIGWGIRGQAGKVVLKMEFEESETDVKAAINTRFRWQDIAAENCPQISLGDGYFGAHYYMEGEQSGLEDMVFLLNECSTWYMTLENRDSLSFKIMCLEDAGDNEGNRKAEGGEKTEKEMNAVRQDPEVRLFVTQRNLQTKQWIKDTVFEVYEWNGYEYAIYRGCLVYDQTGNVYTMDNLVRNEINEGKYKILEVSETEGGAAGWEQEILVPDMQVVTDLYYRVEK